MEEKKIFRISSKLNSSSDIFSCENMEENDFRIIVSQDRNEKAFFKKEKLDFVSRKEFTNSEKSSFKDELVDNNPLLVPLNREREKKFAIDCIHSRASSSSVFVLCRKEIQPKIGPSTFFFGGFNFCYGDLEKQEEECDPKIDIDNNLDRPLPNGRLFSLLPPLKRNEFENIFRKLKEKKSRKEEESDSSSLNDALFSLSDFFFQEFLGIFNRTIDEFQKQSESFSIRENEETQTEIGLFFGLPSQTESRNICQFLFNSFQKKFFKTQNVRVERLYFPSSMTECFLSEKEFNFSVFEENKKRTNRDGKEEEEEEEEELTEEEKEKKEKRNSGRQEVLSFIDFERKRFDSLNDFLTGKMEEIKEMNCSMKSLKKNLLSRGNKIEEELLQRRKELEEKMDAFEQKIQREGFLEEEMKMLQEISEVSSFLLSGNSEEHASKGKGLFWRVLCIALFCFLGIYYTLNVK